MITVLKPLIARLVNHYAGGVVTTCVGALMGWLSTFLLQRFGLALTPEAEARVTLALVVFFTGLITGLVQWWQTGNATALQAALGLKPSDVDGDIGSGTIAAAERIRQASAATQDDIDRTVDIYAMHPPNMGTMRGK